MSEYAKNIQTIEDTWKKRIELRKGGFTRYDPAASELKPCPFCGGEARIFALQIGKGWRVVCSKPFCAQGPNGDTEAEAIAAWNTRAVETCKNVDKYAADGFFICGSCGFGENGIEMTPNHCPSCGRKVER